MKQYAVWTLISLLTAGSWANEAPQTTNEAESFEKADIDVNGIISRWEFLAYEKQRAKKAGTKFDIKAAGALFDSLDTDGSKSLSKVEFIQLAEIRQAPQSPQDENSTP